ncbi:hypothetical protein [Lactobacillus gigeriorum]|uniref:DUF3139 domain-containing protein n=1 Tax=Lactobacillus gigeriorum DSM 23908 = CRBIP 24.85 TaxID=1423751 RepID=I7LDR7_9LACO|nr:hypothetical protein [Lactobacillus gigeriorum]KRN11182.1 hypothetical protein FC38_GL000862 [Lactobacillus gigeriorum DSM 23908 = CRBIP 24.85]CCI87551.1 Protein of unknown function [Lactobacillus gigeriorum DSM 23908 = CRBIP 24.85]
MKNNTAKMFLFATTISIFCLIAFIFIGNTIWKNYLIETTITQESNRDYRTDKNTLIHLQKRKSLTVDITSDNQGSGDILYYVEEINGRFYDVTYKNKNGQLKLKSIFLHPDNHD